MAQYFPPVTTIQYQEEREKWLTEVARGDNVAILFFPKTDRFRRMNQLLEDKLFLKQFFGKTTRYLFQVSDFNVSLVEDRYDMQEHIARQLNLSNLTSTPQTFDQWMMYFNSYTIRLVLILFEGEKYLKEENKHILSILYTLTTEFSPMLSCMSFYEVDITHPTFLPIVFSAKDLFENIFWYPLYSDDDILVFIKYLQKKWNMRIDSKTEQKIITACGGHLWLVKESVRELLNTGSWSIEEEGMRFRVDSIYHSLLNSEQKTLRSVITNAKRFTQEELHSKTYLEKMSLLREGACAMGLLHRYIVQHEHNSADLILTDGSISLNQVPLEGFFSRKEYRVLKALLERKGQVVSRNDIASFIWPTKTEEHYSDWAIDQLFARLRRRLIELTLSPQIIQAVRGKGYRFSC